MVYKSIVGDLQPVPTGNAVAGFFASPFLNDPAVQDSPMYVDSVTGTTITVGQFRKLVPRAAHVLRSKYNVQQGDVVGLFGPNSVFTPAIHMSTISLAATLSPANVMYNSEELAHQLKMTQPKILIAFDPLEQTARSASELAKCNTQLVKFSELFATLTPLISAKDAPGVEPVEVDGKSAHAYYCFSSGTSGLPKGVITTHFNIIANALQVMSSGSPHLAQPDKAQSCVLPMSHIFALNTGVWTGPYTGRKTVIFPKFDLEDFVSKVCEYKLKVLYLVPPIILALGKLPILDKYPEFGETVELILSGAAPVSKETIGLLTSKCPKIQVAQGYGLTETTPITHAGSTRLFDKYDPATIGWLIPGAEARLVDPETGKDVEGFEKRGELWVRGPMVMAGYLKNEAATKDCMTPDGWFKTGDVAIVREDLQFCIVDRIKELIKSNGHQVAPAELESILLSNPSVVDSAVIGVYNKDKTSEMPRAYLVVKEGTQPKEIVDWFNKRVAKHKRLWGGAVIVKEIPKSASGKILRKDLSARTSTEKNIVYGSEIASL